ncbi:hypothetical protein CapIbe_012579 [Capra ibex]
MDGRILGMSPLQSGQEAVIHSEYLPGSPEETEDRYIILNHRSYLLSGMFCRKWEWIRIKHHQSIKGDLLIRMLQ